MDSRIREGLGLAAPLVVGALMMLDWVTTAVGYLLLLCGGLALLWGFWPRILAALPVGAITACPPVSDDEFADLIDEAFPEVEVECNGVPQFLVEERDDDLNINYIVIPDVRIISREPSQVSLDWYLSIEMGQEKPRLSIRRTRRTLPQDLEEELEAADREIPEILTPPRDFPRPGIKSGWLVFQSRSLWGTLSASEYSDEGVFPLYLTLKDYQTNHENWAGPAVSKDFRLPDLILDPDWLAD